MRIKSIEISNIGIVGHELIKINKALLLFYGDIKQGKTTILNSVKLCFGGSFPQDIIKHGEKEAFVHIKFDEGSIRREFYIAKDETTKARAIQFVNGGGVEKKPIEAIKKFLNPFLLDQNHLFNMSGPDRDRFFIDLFGVDTSGLDKESATVEQEAKDLRSEIKGFGKIDLTPVVKPNMASLKLEKANIDADNNVIKKRYQDDCKAITDHNNKVATHELNIASEKKTKEGNEKEIARIDKQIWDLQNQKKQLMNQNDSVVEWLKKNPPLKTKDNPPEPEYKPTAEVDEKISQAKADEVRYETYLERVKRSEEKTEKENELKTKAARLAEIKKAKVAKLAEISETIDIDGLSFDENGNFIYDDTSAGMLSTSQLMTLSSELSKLYPDSMGLELIDRGESLGTSIFEFVKKAEKEEKTILAAIVGVKPAEVPENVGVFVVKGGCIK
ncbi:MAG TPA: hypothetical protein VMW25_02590 [Clostridia bacterium]|nr:hypothetical protein [Clostridia bacterium]